MPARLRRPCAHIGCPRLVVPPERYCPQHKQYETALARSYETRPGSTARGYSYRWQQESKAFLLEHPLCECDECQRLNRWRPSATVDHRIPHRGDMALFWDKSNWMAMAKECHDRKTARGE